MYIVQSSKPLKNKLYMIILKSDKGLEKYEISEEILVEFRLLTGKELSKKNYDKFKIANDRDLVFQKVLHYALYKMRCEKEIFDYLDKKKIPFSQQNYYLNKLKKAKIIDDIRYSEVFVRENFSFKRIGPNKIMHALDLKKVNRTYYQHQIEQIKSSEIEENLTYWFEKKLNSSKNKSQKAVIQNMKQYLINKGYSYEVVNQFVHQRVTLIKDTIDDTIVLKNDYVKAKKKYLNKESSKQKIIATLLRKGYEYNKIKAVMGENV